VKKAFASIAASAALAALTLAPAANAATEFGDTCGGDAPIPGKYTVTTLSSPAGSLPLAAPVSGVMTQVKMQVSYTPLPFTLPELVKVLRPAGGDNYTLVGQTTLSVTTGLNVGGARIPVLAGDKLGVRGLPFAGEPDGASFACMQPGVLGIAEGESTNFIGAAEARVPLTGVIEPDADGDGFGDETQDLCPQSAALQTPCPIVTLDSVGQPGARAVVVLVATDSEAPVNVRGVVNLGKGKKVTLKTGSKSVPPGKLVRFKLKFNGKLKKRLKGLPRSKKLTLKITADATNVAGQVSSDKTKVKLKGQGR
jgi:hypothetical protein